jgi:hypothetical protein
MAVSSSLAASPWRPRVFRYSLRALLIALTLTCVGLWYWYRVPFTKEIDHPRQDGVFHWMEQAGPVPLGREVQRFRRVLRGKPIREGRTEWYDIEGHLVIEENWREGSLHGPMIRRYTNGKVRERGQYYLGQMDGVWENYDEQGQLTLRSRYQRGRPHGEWQRFDEGKLACTILFEQGEVTQINGKAANDLLGRALRLGQIDSEKIRDAVLRRTMLGYNKNARFGRFHLAIHTDSDIPYFADPKCKPKANSPLLTTQVDHITVGAMLVLLLEPHDLTPTYRFGMIWVTTQDDAASWVDRTGTSKLLDTPPGKESDVEHDIVRTAFAKPAKLYFKDSPLGACVGNIRDDYGLPILCDESIKDLPVTGSYNYVTLQNALGALCDQQGLRIRWKDGATLVIERQAPEEK